MSGKQGRRPGVGERLLDGAAFVLRAVGRRPAPPSRPAPSSPAGRAARAVLGVGRDVAAAVVRRIRARRR